MPTIRLIRLQHAPDGRGPGNGQYALQRLLRAAAPPWLQVGGAMREGDVPWVWSYLDWPLLSMHAAMGLPFVAGPNVLFADSSQPRAKPYEREVCDAASCALLFTESSWYADLIAAHRGPANRAPIVLWPYPIAPLPPGPAPRADLDLLVYTKSGFACCTLVDFRRRWPRIKFLHYGQYRREQLWQAAARARCCAYLSDDDRGPLALAEIMLCGCPAVGVPRGAPWIEPGVTGYFAGSLGLADLLPAIEAAREIPREAVRAAAICRFDGRRTVATILDALDGVRSAAV